MANSCQKKIENIRPGTVFMFVDKSGNVVKAKEFDEHEYGLKEARRHNNSSLQKSVTQSSKSYTASVQQRALQIVNDSTKRENVSEQKKSPHDGETLRISSGKCARPKANGGHKDIPVKESSLKKSLQKNSCQEPSGIGRNQSKNPTHQREAQKTKAKTKPEPDSTDEKALVKAKPKRTRMKPNSYRKPSQKGALDTLTPLKDNGGDTDGVWFECNVPFRVKIPFPIFTKKLFGMMPLSAGCSTIPKGKDFVDAGLERNVGCPPSFPSMCITMIPGTNSNTSPDQWTSSQLEQLNETTGTPKKKSKGIKRCSACETCTQTGSRTNEKAPSDPVLSCLEQIREHLSAENENAQKKETLKQKYTCRFFAEKSTSVRSLQRAATSTNCRTSTKESKQTKHPKNVEYSSERTEPSICYNRFPKCPTTRMFKVCNAALFKQPPVSGHAHREAPPAHEPKRYTPDNGFLGSGNVSVSSSSHISHQQQYQVGRGSTNSGQDATSNNSRNSDNDNERCSTICRPEGGVSDTQWNDKHTGATIRKEDSFYEDGSQTSHGSQQTEEGRHGRALERDDEPPRMSERMNYIKAKEHRIKQRSQSAPANIKYIDGSQYFREPNRGNQAQIKHVDRQVSDRSGEDVLATIMATNRKIFENKRCSPQEQPVLLMPFRVENKNIGQGKAKEWRKLTLTNVTKVTPKQFRIVSGYANGSASGSSRVPKASPPYARAVPRRAPPAADVPGRQCRSMQGQSQSRAYPTSALRCPRHPNGPTSNRNGRNPVACNRFRTAAPRNREQLQSEYREVAPTRRNQPASVNSFEDRASRQPALSADSSDNTGPSADPPQSGVNRSIGSSCAIDSTSINLQHSAERSPGVSQQTLTEQTQCPPCLAACRPQCKERSLETVTLMQPRPLRSTESFQSDSYEDQGATPMENQLQPGLGPPECHFGSRQCTGVHPARSPNSSMGDFGINQQKFRMGVGYQSNPHAQPYISAQQSCFNSTGLIDPRHLLPTVSASLQSNQMPMGVYQCHQPVQCQQPTDMYGNQCPFYSPEDLKESIRIMPMGFYEQTIHKYKINPLDSNFKPPSLDESFFQHLQQQMEVNSCSISNQSQQQQPLESAGVYGYPNQHCIHQQQHGSSACSCPYIMPQNPYPQQQQTQQEMQFQDFDHTEI